MVLPVKILCNILINGLSIQLSHVRRVGNKVVDNLANLGVNTCRTVREKDWDMIPDGKDRSRCKFLEAHDKDNL